MRPGEAAGTIEHAPPMVTRLARHVRQRIGPDRLGPRRGVEPTHSLQSGSIAPRPRWSPTARSCRSQRRRRGRRWWRRKSGRMSGARGECDVANMTISFSVVIARSEATSNPGCLRGKILDCFASLAMTGVNPLCDRTPCAARRSLAAADSSAPPVMRRPRPGRGR